MLDKIKKQLGEWLPSKKQFMFSVGVTFAAIILLGIISEIL